MPETFYKTLLICEAGECHIDWSAAFDVFLMAFLLMFICFFIDGLLNSGRRGY